MHSEKLLVCLSSAMAASDDMVCSTSAVAAVDESMHKTRKMTMIGLVIAVSYTSVSNYFSQIRTHH